jgi:prevent-host-death family protein
MQINILDAKNRLSELVRRVQAGGEVVIANRGAPVARLVPAIPAESRPLAAPAASARSLLAWLDAHPLPAHLQRSADDIDADLQRERDAWE